MMDFLIRNGAHVNQTHLTKVTPLMSAAFSGRQDMANALLNNRADIHAKDRLHKTAMVYAAGTGHTSVVDILLSKGVKPDERYANDLTALMWAAGGGHVDTVKFLPDSGADPGLRDNRDKTALQMAEENRHAEVARMLQKKWVKPADLAGVFMRPDDVSARQYAAEVHGTAVAGVIAARAGNGIGIAGVAPGARLLALRACREHAMKPARCNSFTLAKALHFAILHRAEIINLSLSGSPDRLLRGLLNEALARGIKLVAAADPKSKDGDFPASHSGVLAVTDVSPPAAMTTEAHLLSAPGGDIPATAPAGRWTFVSGPSFAASHISGLIALITEVQPMLSAELVQQALADDPNGIGATGYVDACTALSRVTRFCSCACVESQAAADSGS